MAKTYTPVPFFDPHVVLKAQQATHQYHLGTISIEHFANGETCTVACCEETGELLVQVGTMGRKGHRFIQGLEV